VPFCQPSGGQERAVGRRADRREDEGVSVGKAGAGWGVRVLGVDAGRAFEARAVRGTAGGSGCS
jgi:hypothetical protein